MTVQSMEALAKADKIRIGRAELRRRVGRHGDLCLADVLGLPIAANARVFDVLRWQWQWGPARATRLMRRAGIGDYRRIGDLTERQVQMIVDATS